MNQFNALQRLVMWMFRIHLPTTPPTVVYTSDPATFKKALMGELKQHRTRTVGFARELSAGYAPNGGAGYKSRDPYAEAAPKVFAVDPGKDEPAVVAFTATEEVIQRIAWDSMPRHVRDRNRARALLRRVGFWKGVDPTTGNTVDLLLNSEAWDVVIASKRISLSAEVISRVNGWGVHFPSTLECL
jgi:hypothetical protein